MPPSAQFGEGGATGEPSSAGAEHTGGGVPGAAQGMWGRGAVLALHWDSVKLLRV